MAPTPSSCSPTRTWTRPPPRRCAHASPTRGRAACAPSGSSWSRSRRSFWRSSSPEWRTSSFGDPSEEKTSLGPLARGELRDGVLRQIEASVAAGATLLAGGRPLDGPGYFLEPTLLGDTRPGIAAFDEETFGPVATIAVARDEAHAVELAGPTQFGLGLSIWSADLGRARSFARGVTTGAVLINAMVASDPRVPFCGTKRSGYGRELADVGLREFVNTRTYWAVPSS